MTESEAAMPGGATEDQLTCVGLIRRTSRTAVGRYRR